MRLVALSFLLGLPLTACSLASAGDDPGPVAERLAAALSEHSLDGVPLAADSDADRLAELVAPLDDLPVEVEVGEVTEDGDTATATLRWTWQVDGAEWRYRTQARLVNDGDRWEVDWKPSTLEPSLRSGHRLGLFTDAGRRGRILGQGGEPLVVPRPVLRYGLDKTAVRPRRVADSARRIAESLDIDPAGYVEQAKAAGAKAFVEAIVLRAEDAAETVDPSYGDIPGAVALEDEMPLAPTRGFAAALLGRVGPATAEIVEASDGRVEAGDQVGLSGLQARYESVLGAVPGVRVVAAGPDDVRRTLFRSRGHNGRDLQVSLDADLQMKAESVLAEAAPEGVRSALVAIRPSDGQVLAAANGPANDGVDIATTGQYAPGSTFKVVTALALLRQGLRPEQVLECPDTITVDGRQFENYDDYPADRVGKVSFATAFANSCNTAMIGARELLGEADLRDAAEALGLGRDYDVGFPAYFGQVPPPEGETELAADTIGQGTVLASPLAMATVAASVRAGRTVVPTLFPEADGPEPKVRRPLTAEEAELLRGLMRAVVTEGSGRFLADLPGEVGAKTGTAEYGEPDASGHLATHAWMIATRDDLAVAVFLEDGSSGSGTAGPVLEAFLR